MFDSGFGGLTVARATIDLLPAEDLIYIGDTGRYPYGSKPLDDVREYARELARSLVEDYHAKAIVVACNTATAAGLDALRAALLHAAGWQAPAGGLFMARERHVQALRQVDAHLMEAADTDIEFANGEFSVKGTDKKIPFGQVALTAYVPHNYPLDKLEPGLNETAFYDPTNFTFPAGTYIAEVEVNPNTGEVKLDRFTAVDDFGTIINPMIVEGQVHGGLVQGIGQALMERCVYDRETGQLLTGSFMDYAMPRFDNLPSFKTEIAQVLSPTNPFGIKAGGEGGTTPALAVIASAVEDALMPICGPIEIPMPITPVKIWTALDAARKNKEGLL